jgi:hypothetical protein
LADWQYVVLKPKTEASEAIALDIVALAEAIALPTLPLQRHPIRLQLNTLRLLVDAMRM